MPLLPTGAFILVSIPPRKWIPSKFLGQMGFVKHSIRPDLSLASIMRLFKVLATRSNFRFGMRVSRLKGEI